MKILSVVGARPEFIQAAPIWRALQRREHIQEVWVHTGQHYDYQMAEAFFADLGLPAPHHNLGVGSGSHATQTAAILCRMEEVMVQERPDVVVVRGDTNSTIGAALAAAKLQIPVAHVEAGERSYDRRMPEEVNRLVTDRLADLHFCASQAAVRQLGAEGYVDSVHWVGDVMFDAMLQHRELAQARSSLLKNLGLRPGGYALVTVHRAGNTDDPDRLGSIVTALNRVEEPVVFPVHPRTRQALERFGLGFAPHVRMIEPVGYFDMMMLEAHARLIATDSGGVQREAYFLQVPCLTLRDESEWMETVAAGWNRLVGVAPDSILAAWHKFTPPADHPPIFGDGTAGEQIAALLEARTRQGQPVGMQARNGKPSSNHLQQVVA
jgi:UDP-N-acetylglucosamine 2-epimerase